MAYVASLIIAVTCHDGYHRFITSRNTLVQLLNNFLSITWQNKLMVAALSEHRVTV